MKDLEQMTSLEKLKLLQNLKEELGTGSRYDTDEFMNLSLAWAKGEITVTVIREVIGNNNYASCVAIGLRRAVKKGILVESENADTPRS